MSWAKDLVNGAVAIVVLALVVGAGLLALVGFQGGLTSGTAAYNATGDFITGLAEVANWPTTLIILLVVSVIIGLVMVFAKKASQK
jgi:hypothetical protein